MSIGQERVVINETEMEGMMKQVKSIKVTISEIRHVEMPSLGAGMPHDDNLLRLIWCLFNSRGQILR